MEFIRKINHWQILAVAAIVHVVIAFFSTGYLHFDEYFSINEFLNYKLGGIRADQLPYDFHEGFRPWFQVFVYYYLTAPLRWLGVDSPFTLILFLRIFTSLFGLYALSRMIPHVKRWISPTFYPIAILIIFFAWFMPYIHVRTNNESFGITFLILALSFYLNEKKIRGKIPQLIGIGLLFGFSYQSRFQMALPVAFIWFWSIFIGKYETKTYVWCAVGIFLGILSGLIFDYWGYGKWNFSLWHYYRINFQAGVLAGTKQDPVWYYFRWALLRGIPPLSLVFIIPTLWFWIRKWRHPLTWVTLPLFVFHSLIGHKEMRYIFPVIAFTPIFLAMGLDFYHSKLQDLWKGKWFQSTTYFFIGFNMLMLVIVTFRPTNPSENFFRYVYHSNIEHICAVPGTPYKAVGLDIEFFRKKNIEVTEAPMVAECPEGTTHYFFSKGSYLDTPEMNTCQLEYLTYPMWSLKFNVTNWVNRSRVWSLFNCN